MGTDIMTGKRLNDLTPAECLVLLAPEESEGKEMVKVTLMDLLARRHLLPEEREEQTIFLRRTVRRTYIERGASLTDKGFKPHERILLECVKGEGPVRLDKLVARIASKIRSTKTYKKEYVLNPMTAEGLLERQSTGPFSSAFLLTAAGTEHSESVSDLLNEGQQHLEEWLHEDLRKAKLFLSLIGTKLFLLPNLIPSIRDARDALVNEPIAARDDGQKDGLQALESFNDSALDNPAFDLAFLQLDPSAFDAIGTTSFDISAVDGGGGGGD